MAVPVPKNLNIIKSLTMAQKVMGIFLSTYKQVEYDSVMDWSSGQILPFSECYLTL